VRQVGFHYTDVSRYTVNKTLKTFKKSWNHFMRWLIQGQQNLTPVYGGWECSRLVALDSCNEENFKDSASHLVPMQFLIPPSLFLSFTVHSFLTRACSEDDEFVNRRRPFVTTCQNCASSHNRPTVYPAGHILHFADINKLRKLIWWRTVLRHSCWCLCFGFCLVWEFCFPT
jgi:hypothetical protein